MFFNRIQKVLRLNNLYKFSQIKSYTPLRPLINDRNVLYVDKIFMLKSGIVNKFPSYYAYGLPLLVLINNYFTQWNMINTILFSGSSLLGVLFYLGYKTVYARKVYLLEASQNLQTFYITVPNTIQNNHNVEPPQHKNHIQFRQSIVKQFKTGYNPYLQKYPDAFQKTQVKDMWKTERMVENFYRRNFRIEIPFKQIKQIEFELNPTQKRQLEIDKQKLEVEQLFKKYQNKMIIFKIRLGRFQSIPYRINLQFNQNRKYHDYLIALGLGIPIQQNRIHQKQKSEQNNIQNQQSN